MTKDEMDAEMVYKPRGFNRRQLTILRDYERMQEDEPITPEQRERLKRLGVL